jgi:hypothetical protein
MNNANEEVALTFKGLHGQLIPILGISLYFLLRSSAINILTAEPPRLDSGVLVFNVFTPCMCMSDAVNECNSFSYERYGAVVPQSSISRFVQLIPQFGPKVHNRLTSSNSIELARLFYLNSFGDKEIYLSIYYLICNGKDCARIHELSHL